jgi:ketosteroid isomerase-like protein
VSKRDVELVTAWFRGLEERTLSPEMCHPKIVIRNWDESPLRGPYHGRDGLVEWWADFADVIQDASFELLEAIDLGDGRVLTVNKLIGTFRLTGIPLENAVWGSILTVRDGLIASATGYATPGRAKKAAGLKKPR